MNVKNCLKKENVMPVAVLAAICFIVAALMGVVNMITAPIIEKAELAAVSASLSEVMPGGDFEVAEIPENSPETVTGVYRDKVSSGWVVTLSTAGYGGEIAITVGVDSSGKITKAVVTKESETHGQAGMKNYTDRFTGLDAAGAADAELYSQATISSTAIKSAIVDAMIALGYATAQEEQLPHTDAEILAYAKELSGKNVARAEIEEGAPSVMKRLYTADGIFVAYVVVPGQYVPVATEGLVAFDNKGVIKGVRMLDWIVGYDSNLLPAPPECSDEFLDSFVGKTPETIGGVELVTNATGTSTDFRDAVSESVSFVVPELPIYTVIGIIIVVLCVVTAISLKIYTQKRRRNG